MLPNTKVIRTQKGYLTLDVLKESMYKNPICLIISWWEIDMFYNTYTISKDAVMAICPIPTIWPKTPRPPQNLWRLQLCLLHMPFPRLQEWWPSHGASQQSPWWGRGPVRKTLTPTHVHENPLIFAGHDMLKTKAYPTGSTHSLSKN